MTVLRTGRLLEHDPKSKDFPAPAADVHSVLWANHGPRLNQGHRHACTGFAMAHALNTVPLHGRSDRYLGASTALGLYGWATRLDGMPGNTYPEHDIGSSGLGVAKAAVQMKKISRYEWGFGADHALQTLMSGPCIVGTNWYADMYHPDARGFVSVSGDRAGGHEWELLGVDVEGGYVIAMNSWGSAWGQGGVFKLPLTDFARLLDEDGDILLPIR